jgi:hypothetical protein
MDQFHASVLEHSNLFLSKLVDCSTPMNTDGVACLFCPPSFPRAFFFDGMLVETDLKCCCYCLGPKPKWTQRDGLVHYANRCCAATISSWGLTLGVEEGGGRGGMTRNLHWLVSFVSLMDKVVPDETSFSPIETSMRLLALYVLSASRQGI